MLARTKNKANFKLLGTNNNIEAGESSYTINLDMSYNIYAVIVDFATYGNKYANFSCLIFKGVNDWITGGMTGDGPSSRKFTGSSTGIIIEDAKGGTTGNTDNRYCIPRKIYGIN